MDTFGKKVVIWGGLILLIAMVGTFWWLQTRETNNKNTPFASSPTPTSVDATGTIEGSLGFPSETIPSEMQTCAENIQTKEIYCTNERNEDQKYTFRVGYTLEVPTGIYYVYSQLPNDTYKAYYNEFVTCGLSVDCSSHEPIVVSVFAGQTTDGVDPQDWYNRPTPTL